MSAPAGKVWQVISEAGNLEACHPFCASNPVEIWPGAGARDEVHYLNGVVFERSFRSWFDGVGYDLEIGKPGEALRSFVSWRIVPDDKDQSILRITVYPGLLQNWPTPLRWLAYRLYIAPLLQKYLDSVLRGFEWYITRGTAVQHDQFGRHPWFSR